MSSGLYVVGYCGFLVCLFGWGFLQLHCNLGVLEYVVFINLGPVYYLCLWQISSNHLDWKDSWETV